MVTTGNQLWMSISGAEWANNYKILTIFIQPGFYILQSQAHPNAAFACFVYGHGTTDKTAYGYLAGYGGEEASCFHQSTNAFVCYILLPHSRMGLTALKTVSLMIQSLQTLPEIHVRIQMERIEDSHPDLWRRSIYPLTLICHSSK